MDTQPAPANRGVQGPPTWPKDAAATGRSDSVSNMASTGLPSDVSSTVREMLVGKGGTRSCAGESACMLTRKRARECVCMFFALLCCVFLMQGAEVTHCSSKAATNRSTRLCRYLDRMPTGAQIPLQTRVYQAHKLLTVLKPAVSFYEAPVASGSARSTQGTAGPRAWTAPGPPALGHQRVCRGGWRLRASREGGGGHCPDMQQ